MVALHRVVSFAASLSSVTAPFKKRTVVQVLANVAIIKTRVDILDAAFDAFPVTGATILQALNIQKLTMQLAWAINKGTADALITGFVDEAESMEVLKNLQALVPVIVKLLNNIIAKKPAIEALISIGGISATKVAKLGIESVEEETVTFENTLLSIAPAALRPAGIASKTVLDIEFSKAIAAYSTK